MYLWEAVDCRGDVDDGVAVEDNRLDWPDGVGEEHGGVGEHLVAERRCCLPSNIGSTDNGGSLHGFVAPMEAKSFISVNHLDAKELVDGHGAPVGEDAFERALLPASNRRAPPDVLERVLVRGEVERDHHEAKPVSPSRAAILTTAARLHHLRQCLQHFVHQEQQIERISSLHTVLHQQI